VSLEVLMLSNVILIITIAYLIPESARDEAISTVPLLLSLAASDAAVGLGILVTTFKYKRIIKLSELQRLQG
jgi:NADH:ubiquinone oxidoreductase subunit K